MMGRNRPQGTKQIIKHIDNAQYLRLLVQRGEYQGVYTGTIELMDKLALKFEAQGYIVTKEIRV